MFNIIWSQFKTSVQVFYRELWWNPLTLACNIGPSLHSYWVHYKWSSLRLLSNFRHPVNYFSRKFSTGGVFNELNFCGKPLFKGKFMRSLYLKGKFGGMVNHLNILLQLWISTGTFSLSFVVELNMFIYM